MWLCGSVVRLCDSVFTSLDTDIRLVVCACWDDVFTLLAALLRRNSSATHPSVSAALAKRWRSFAGTLIFHSEMVKVAKVAPNMTCLSGIAAVNNCFCIKIPPVYFTVGNLSKFFLHFCLSL